MQALEAFFSYGGNQLSKFVCMRFSHHSRNLFTMPFPQIQIACLAA